MKMLDFLNWKYIMSLVENKCSSSIKTAIHLSLLSINKLNILNSASTVFMSGGEKKIIQI